MLVVLRPFSMIVSSHQVFLSFLSGAGVITLTEWRCKIQSRQYGPAKVLFRVDAALGLSRAVLVRQALEAATALTGVSYPFLQGHLRRALHVTKG